MSKQDKEKMLELLSDKAFAGGLLGEAELAELAKLEESFPELKSDDSFELTAASVSLTNLDVSEPMPEHLQAKILADADKYFAAQSKTAKVSADDTEEDYQKTFVLERAVKSSSIRHWLGWAVAGLACLALAVNVYVTRTNPPVERVYQMLTPTPTPSFPEQRERLLASADVIKTALTNPKNPNEVVGEIVWSDAQQKGFLSLRGVPANDKTKEQYQLWIVAANQNPKTPVDGGVFDVSGNEIIIPIDAKVKVQKPTLFAITAEKPGGVPVSTQEKVMAIAKVET